MDEDKSNNQQQQLSQQEVSYKGELLKGSLGKFSHFTIKKGKISFVFHHLYSLTFFEAAAVYFLFLFQKKRKFAFHISVRFIIIFITCYSS